MVNLLLLFLVCVVVCSGDKSDSVWRETQYSPERALSICQETWQRKIIERGVRERRNEKYNNKHTGIVDEPPMGDKQSDKSILFIHVGKTCGDSVMNTLENKGIKMTTVHLAPADEIMINQFDYVIISIRDPFQRTVSAFNYCADVYHSKMERFLDKKNAMSRMYTCFQHVEQYTHALYEHTECGEFARAGDGVCHINYDLCSYLGGLAEALHKKRDKVFLVRTASCEADLRRTLELIGLDSSIVTSKSMSVHTDAKPANSTSLSLPAQMKLRGYLETIGEYDMYRYLLQEFTKE